jgi:hypothetical protein
LAQALRKALHDNDVEMFLKMSNGFKEMVLGVDETLAVTVQGGGPFNKKFGEEELGDVVIYLLSDVTDIDTKSLVAIKKGNLNMQKIWEATYKKNPL